jgi:SAM-dependent methyltransferase/glycosyltransferase involved in cell wall biosynthesis
MHRSGTSLVARLLHAMGANLGSKIDVSPVTSNPFGHWEHDEIWRIQERLLIELGREWHTSPGPLPERWLEWPETRRAMDAIQSVCQNEAGERGHFVVKDPRSTRLLTMWIELAEHLQAELKVVCVVRRPGEVAASLLARDGMPAELASRIWMEHHLDALAAGAPLEFFFHEDLFQNSVAAVRSLVPLCALDGFLTGVESAARLVDSRLRHHEDLEARGSAEEESLYADLRRGEGLRRWNQTRHPPEDRGRVLIVARTRWREIFLPRLLRSVLGQTYRNWFLQIVNDGGPPHLVESAVAPYRHLLGERLSILHLENQVGMEAASNRGIAGRDCDYIAIHDDDDTWQPEFLEKTTAYLSESGETCVVARSTIVQECWDGERYVETGRTAFGPFQDRVTARELEQQNFFPPIALLMRSQAYRDAGPFCEQLPVLGDWDFNKKLAAGKGIKILPDTLAYWHGRRDSKHPNSDDINGHHRFSPFLLSRNGSVPLPSYHPKTKEVRLRVSTREIWDFFPGWNLHPAILHHITSPGGILYQAIGEDPQILIGPEGGTPDFFPMPAGLYLLTLRLKIESENGRPQVFFHEPGGDFSEGDSQFLSGEGGLFALLITAENGISGLRLDPIAGEGEFQLSDIFLWRLGDALTSLGRFSPRPRLPDVLCIGAQKSATTWLHRNLQRHPGVWKCPVKEFHHFGSPTPDISRAVQKQAFALLRSASDDDARRFAVDFGFGSKGDGASYSALFEQAPPSLAACDFTPAYAALPESEVAQIARLMPEAKILFLLRDPVERALAGARHDLRCAGNTSPSAEEIAEHCRSGENILRTDYQRTLEIWSRHFPAENIHVEFFDDIHWQPGEVLTRIARFLGLQDFAFSENDLLAPLNESSGDFEGGDPFLKAELSARWLPMMDWLEKRHGGAVQQWIRKAASRLAAPSAMIGGAQGGGPNTVTNNLAVWDLMHPWSRNGDEWNGQAVRMGLDYDSWKEGMAERYFPRFFARGTVLEIGPGRGRWTRILAQTALRLVLADISPNCLEACRRLLRGKIPIRTHLSLGSDLPADLSGGVDGVWSFDCFVHIGAAEFEAYLLEIGRVLKPGGTAVIHHADRSPSAAFRFFKKETENGWRSPVRRRDVRRWAQAAGLDVVVQENRWRSPKPSGVPRFGDCISVLQKRPSAF